jgi:hypothetical protein
MRIAPRRAVDACGIAIVFALLSAPAFAQDPTPAPAASPEAQPKPAAFSGLLGDFGHGDRSRLADHGFSVNGHLTSEAACVNGAARRDSHQPTISSSSRPFVSVT